MDRTIDTWTASALDSRLRGAGLSASVLVHCAIGWLAWSALSAPAYQPPTPLEVRFVAIEAPRPIAVAPPLAEAPSQRPAPQPAESPTEPRARPATVRAQPAPARPRDVRRKPPARRIEPLAVAAPDALPRLEAVEPASPDRLAPGPTPIVAAPLAPPPPVEPSAPGAAPATASVAMPAASEPIAVTPPRAQAAYLNNPAPAYPQMSRRLGEQGRVVLRVFVEPDGRPSQVAVRSSSGFPRLDSAAVEAVRDWMFVPARRGSESVAAWVLIPLNFLLNNS